MKDSIQKFGVNFNSVNCPLCKTEQPYVRKPKGLYEILWGSYTCLNCGCKMDKFGKERP